MNRYYLCIIDRKTVICKEEDTASCITKKGLLHECPYRLAALATSPALAGEAKMPQS